MQLNELFLAEAIEQTLVVASHDELKKAFDEFVHNSLPEISKFVGVSRYERQYQYTKAAYGESDYDAWDKYVAPARDKIFDNWDSRKLTSLKLGDEFRDELLLELKHVLELTFQDVARDYFERKFGKIESIDQDGDFSSQLKSKNLNWLQHILVNLDFKGVSDTNTQRKQTGGGYFAQTPNKGHFNTRYAQTEVDWQTDLSQGIKIYCDQNGLWAAIVSGAYDALCEEYLGEAADSEQQFEKWIAKCIPTFVHEVVHMEQDTRIRVKNQQGQYPKSGWLGTTMLPSPNKKRPSVTDYTKKITQRKGKRGAPNRDPNGVPYPSPDDPNYKQKVEDYNNQWAEYLGDQIEIEAHASGMAAKLILQWLQENRRYNYSPDSRQSSLNHHISYLIKEISDGYTPNEYSFSHYQRFIKSKSPDHKIYARVWRRFIKALVRNLQNHQKQVWPEPNPNADLETRLADKKAGTWQYHTKTEPTRKLP
jgi:hypothetical protein